MQLVEILGICATATILISMCFKTMSFKGSLWMRIINIIGNSLFTTYAILIHSLSSSILGAGIVLVNIYHLIVLVIQHKKQIKS